MAKKAVKMITLTEDEFRGILTKHAIAVMRSMDDIFKTMFLDIHTCMYRRVTHTVDEAFEDHYDRLCLNKNAKGDETESKLIP